MPRPTIFLSHASKDKPFVRRLDKDLKSHGFDTWLDEVDIPFGASIPDEIQKGIAKCEIMFVFLSEYSVISRWVATEWQTKFFKEVNEKKIYVVPVLIQKCQIPDYLSGKRYIDFVEHDEYEKNLSQTLEFLSKISNTMNGGQIPKFTQNQGILSHVQEILEDLSSESLSFPVYKKLLIVETLKKMARSGKHVRLIDFKPTVKSRSIYDHILSLAHLADSVLPHIDHGLGASEVRDLSLCIAYHELNEVILGDIPSYTSLTTSKRKAARVYAEERLRNVAPDEREQIANRMIWMFLSEKHRQAFLEVINIFSEKNGKVFRIFRALDKLDPIVAVWRYLHHYRGGLGETPREFNRKMKDFYENPDIRRFIDHNKLDNKLIELTIFLQDRTNSWNYYENPDHIFNDKNLFNTIPAEAVRNAIEGINLFHKSE